jgi:hypothetical protein
MTFDGAGLLECYAECSSTAKTNRRGRERFSTVGAEVTEVERLRI